MVFRDYISTWKIRKIRRINEAETTREEEGGGEEEEEGFHWKLCYDYIIMSFSLLKKIILAISKISMVLCRFQGHR